MEPGRRLIDRCRLVFLIFMLNGIGMLLPWNMFINAISYFEHCKLGYTNGTSEESQPYKVLFLQNLTSGANIPLVIFHWLNAFIRFRGRDMTKRILASLSVNIFIFTLTIVLAMVDSTDWTGVFVIVTIFSVFVLNAANGIYCNAFYGIVAKFPPKYMGVVILGHNISGVLASIAAILFSATNSDLRIAAIYYFTVALFILMLCVDSYLVLPLIKYYWITDYIHRHEKEEESGRNSKVPYALIFKKGFPQFANIFLNFTVTLSTFPSVQANIKPIGEDEFLSEDMYVMVVCFLTFNVFSMIGSLTANYVRWPPPKYVIIPILLRMFYIPFFILCNYQVRGIQRITPIYIKSDWIYWIVSTTMALSNGYLSCLIMQYIPGTVEARYSFDAGLFGGAVLVTGVFTGVLCSYLWPVFIENVG